MDAHAVVEPLGKTPEPEMDDLSEFDDSTSQDGSPNKDDDGSITEEGQDSSLARKKRERRSKDDNSKRNYICGCGKMYLSYAALYTHAKVKHQSIFPEGTTTLHKKKQGRPKLTLLQRRKLFATEYQVYLQKLGASRSDSDTPIDLSHPLHLENYADVSATSEIVSAIHNAYLRLKEKYPEETTKKIDDYIGECAGKHLSCDFIFGLFALYSSRFVSQTFFRELVLFLCMYRTAINAEGWTKQVAAGGQPLSNMTAADYCDSQSAEFVPDIANSFILDYFPSLVQGNSVIKQPASLLFIGKDHTRLSGLILLISHLCSWLNLNKFSEARVNLSKS